MDKNMPDLKRLYLLVQFIVFKSKSIKKTNLSLSDIKKQLKNAAIKVGVPKSTGSAIHEDSSITIAGLAMVHEFGSPARNIPERSFIRSTVQAKRNIIKKLFIQQGKKIMDGQVSTKDGLSIVGEFMQGEIKKTIVALKTPPNKPSTIKKKGSSNPLVDTGQLLQSIKYEVIDD